MGSPNPIADINRFAVTTFVERAAASIPDNSRVLDAGAGEGKYRSLFAKHDYVTADLAVGDPDWDYSGLDVVTDLGRLPFSEDTFDAVLSTQTLEHLAEPAIFLTEAARVLKAGGRLFLTAPQSFRLHQAPHDYYRYTTFGLRHLVTTAGLSVESIDPQGGYFWFLADAIRPLHRRLFGKERSLAWRIPTAPLALVSKLFFTRLIPLLFFHLDHLDTKRTMTTGHELVAVKGGAE
jgi:ubiquinone/menaquinone biosynthesis C-methylase UbiE